MKVQRCATQMIERVKILEFFTLVAELCKFNVEMINRLLVEPWEKEAAQTQFIYSQVYNFNSVNSEKEHEESDKTLANA